MFFLVYTHTPPLSPLSLSPSLPPLSPLSLPQEPGAKFDSEDHIKDNQCDIVKVLVAHGASLSSRDSSGSSAKDLANDHDFFEAVDLLEELEGEGERGERGRGRVILHCRHVLSSMQ